VYILYSISLWLPITTLPESDAICTGLTERSKSFWIRMYRFHAGVRIVGVVDQDQIRTKNLQYYDK